MVKSRAIRVMGLILGMRWPSYQSLPLALVKEKRVRTPARNVCPSR
jgi:hypothetical protein